MSNKYSLIVFDWDGTLMDSEAKIVSAMQSAIAESQLPERTRNEIKDIIGLGLQEALQQLFPDVGDVQQLRLVERYRYHFVTTDKTPMPLFDGVEALLESLNEQGYWLAVATGKSRRGLDRVLDEYNFHIYFHATRCADESFSKAHPRMLEEIMGYLGVEPAETLMVGDSEYDMLMARNASAHALAVSCGVHEKERLLSCGALGCIDDIRDVPGWL